MERTLKQALIDNGFTFERVERDGKFKGMRILKNGEQVHETPYASAEFGWELVHHEESKKN